RLARADSRGDDEAGQPGEHAGVGVDEDLVPAYVDAGDPSRLLVAADGIDVLPELGPGVEDVRYDCHPHQDQDGDRDAEEVPLADDVVGIGEVRERPAGGVEHGRPAGGGV